MAGIPLQPGQPALSPSTLQAGNGRPQAPTLPALFNQRAAGQESPPLQGNTRQPAMPAHPGISLQLPLGGPTLVQAVMQPPQFLPLGDPTIAQAAMPGIVGTNRQSASVAPLAPKYRWFQEFYADETKDPCQGSYQRVMQRFDYEHAQAADPATLFEQAVSSNGLAHQAYFCCASTRRGPRIYCIHMPSRFASAVDG
jgi:hypothetical protein